MDDAEVAPRKHGANTQPIACRHIVRYMDTMASKPVGFHTAPSDKRRFPDAWCTACDKRLVAAGDEWTPAVLARADFQAICPCCYDFARAAQRPGAVVVTGRWR